MRKSLSVFLWFILVAALPSHLTAQGYRSLKAVIETESGKRNVEIQYFPGSEEWAKDLFRVMKDGFPLLEEKIGVPCTVSWDILIKECDNLDKGVAAQNRGSLGIEVATRTSPSVIIHELCHYWFGCKASIDWNNWILEGFPEAYTVLVLRELNHPDGYSHWYSRLDQYEEAKAKIGDSPLSKVGYAPDFTDPRVAMLYSKSMVFGMWLITCLGDESMHRINAEIVPRARLSTEEYQKIAEEVTGKDLDSLFSGWVYPGDYFYEGARVSFQWFAGDGDKDGIDTLEEIRMQLPPLIKDKDKDGLPDGQELFLKTDPSNPDTDGDGLKDGREVTVSLDGENMEWANPFIEDEKDATSQDIKAVYYATDNQFIYFMIQFYNQCDIAYHTGISVDTNDDDQEYIFFTSYDHLFLSVWEKGVWVKTIVDPSSLKDAAVVTDKVTEFRIPKRMSEVRLPATFRVWAYEYSVVEDVFTDTTAAAAASLNLNKKESSNPQNPDTDGDGLKDGEDPNPLVRDTAQPSQTLAPSQSPESSQSPQPAAPEETTQMPEQPEPFPLKGTLLGGVVAALLAALFILKKTRS